MCVYIYMYIYIYKMYLHAHIYAYMVIKTVFDVTQEHTSRRICNMRV